MTGVDPPGRGAEIAYPRLELQRFDYSHSSLRSAGRPVPKLEVTPPRAIVGRQEQAHVQVTDDATRVSRQHLTVEVMGGAWFVTDIGSKHGTAWISIENPRPTSLPQHFPMQLRSGMQILLKRGYTNSGLDQPLPPACLHVTIHPPIRTGTVTDGEVKVPPSVPEALSRVTPDALTICTALVEFNSAKVGWETAYQRGLYKKKQRRFNEELVQLINEVPPLTLLYEEALRDEQADRDARNSDGLLRFDRAIFRKTLLILYPAFATAHLPPG